MVLSLVFLGPLLLAFALAITASRNDHVELSEHEAQARVRPSGGVSRMERGR